MKNKGSIVIIAVGIILVISALATGGVIYYQNKQRQAEQAIGGEKDSHGCLIAAGYSWCDEKQKCLRTWEEECKKDETADWKTYRNEEYGFEFKYPANGNVKTGYDWTPDFWPPQIKIVSLNEDVARACPISNGGYYVSNKRFVEIEGFGNPITLYKLSYNGTKSGSIRYCYIVESTKTENYIAYFEFTSMTDVDHVLEKDVDALTQKIISTFKFTK